MSAAPKGREGQPSTGWSTPLCTRPNTVTWRTGPFTWCFYEPSSRVKPAQRSTGRAGYLEKRESTSERRQRQYTFPRAVSTRWPCRHVSQSPARPTGQRVAERVSCSVYRTPARAFSNFVLSLQLSPSQDRARRAARPSAPDRSRARAAPAHPVSRSVAAARRRMVSGECRRWVAAECSWLTGLHCPCLGGQNQPRRRKKLTATTTATAISPSANGYPHGHRSSGMRSKFIP